MEKMKFSFIAILLFGAIFSLVKTEPTEDKKILLKFIKKIPHSSAINWRLNSSACSNWTGVTCDHHRSSIIALRLPALSFHGPIPPNTLTKLSNLQILSLRSNGLSGPFPSDFSNLKNLTSLHLQCNNFSGPLPVNLSVWNNLSVLNLSNNGFTGIIPPSISYLPHLTVLSLANNSLSGEIPNFGTSSLQILDLSNNFFTGTVPKSLTRFPNSAFLGNHLTLEPSSSSSSLPALSRERKPSKLSEREILAIVIGSSVLVLGLLTILLIVFHLKKEGKNQDSERTYKNEKGMENLRSRSNGNGNGNGNGNLVFFEGSNLAFNLEDLFRASAEVLGKGSFGTTYKAALEDSNAVVVKRLRDVNVTKREFELQMEIVGRIRHENVVPLRAYYYSKDEKLMVYDYFSQGSVCSMLHAKIGNNTNPLDWETRLKIALGVARGISHIHTQSSGKLIHGNIKSSNTFLNHHRHGCISDVALAAITTPATVRGGGTGYQAPETTDAKKLYQSSDVYSYGVLLLELLTGKSPGNATCGNEVVHLVRWVHSVVQEEWTAEVFDVELLRYSGIEEEMVEMLQIAMQCVGKSMDLRPKMVEVVKLVENIRSDSSENNTITF